MRDLGRFACFWVGGVLIATALFGMMVMPDGSKIGLQQAVLLAGLLISGAVCLHGSGR